MWPEIVSINNTQIPTLHVNTEVGCRIESEKRACHNG
jgi:hypothetical protein